MRNTSNKISPGDLCITKAKFHDYYTWKDIPEGSHVLVLKNDKLYGRYFEVVLLFLGSQVTIMVDSDLLLDKLEKIGLS